MRLALQDKILGSAVCFFFLVVLCGCSAMPASSDYVETLAKQVSENADILAEVASNATRSNPAPENVATAAIASKAASKTAQVAAEPAGVKIPLPAGGTGFPLVDLALGAISAISAGGAAVYRAKAVRNSKDAAELAAMPPEHAIVEARKRGHT